MSRRLSLFLWAGFALLLLWGSLSWHFAQASQRAFQNYLAVLSQQSYQHFLEIEVDEYQENFLGAEAQLRVKFAIPSFRDMLGELPLKASRLNGPVFFNSSGVQFGAARWVISVDQEADVVLSNTLKSLFDHALPEAIVRFDFLDQAHSELQVEYLRGSGFSVDGLRVTGTFDLSNGAYDLEAIAEHSRFSMPGVSLASVSPHLIIQRLATNPGMSARSNAAVVDLSAAEAVLSLDTQDREFPLDISSRGSLWLINDTLSGDWQMLLSNRNNLAIKKLNANVQFREWRAEGFLAYWRQQATIANLLEQAEWALEEGAETPEEQDFILSLYSDAEHIKQSQARDILKPMLAYPRSELSVNAQISSNDEVHGQLIAFGKTGGNRQLPQLNIEGEAAIQLSELDKPLVSLLDRWSQRFWVRRYETAFESDFTLRNRQFLLNDIRVSWSDLSSELIQSLNDQ